MRLMKVIEGNNGELVEPSPRDHIRKRLQAKRVNTLSYVPRSSKSEVGQLKLIKFKIRSKLSRV